VYELVCIVGLTLFPECPCCINQEKSTFSLWSMVKFKEISNFDWTAVYSYH